jgi:hypothetical protein
LKRLAWILEHPEPIRSKIREEPNLVQEDEIEERKIENMQPPPGFMVHCGDDFSESKDENERCEPLQLDWGTATSGIRLQMPVVNDMDALTFVTQMSPCFTFKVPKRDRLTVGRAHECDIVVNDDSISPHHANILFEQRLNKFLLESTNDCVTGVYTLVKSGQTIRNGSVVELGSVQILLENKGGGIVNVTVQNGPKHTRDKPPAPIKTPFRIGTNPHNALSFQNDRFLDAEHAEVQCVGDEIKLDLITQKWYFTCGML